MDDKQKRSGEPEVKTYGDYLKEAATLEPSLYKGYLKQYRKAEDACIGYTDRKEKST